MALNEPAPPRWCRRERRPIYWPHIHFHHLFSTALLRDETAVFHTQFATGKSPVNTAGLATPHLAKNALALHLLL